MASTGLIDRVVRPHVAAREDAYLNSKNVSGVTESFLPQDMPSGARACARRRRECQRIACMHRACARTQLLACSRACCWLRAPLPHRLPAGSCSVLTPANCHSPATPLLRARPTLPPCCCMHHARRLAHRHQRAQPV